MPIALVIHLQALADGSITGSTGRAVHGFWYRHWGEVAPEVAEGIHRDDEVPPFSLSPLMGMPPPHRGSWLISAGQSAWVRIAVLSDSLITRLQDDWLPPLPVEIELAETFWKITGLAFSTQEHPWAGQVGYSELASQKLFTVRPPLRWAFEFASPAAFHASAGHLPFPLPDSLVGSWLRRWQAFAPLALPADLPQIVREHVVMSAYSLHTVPVRHGERLTVGCVGQFELQALQLSPAYRAAIDALAAYAFYSGSGHHTTQGMGLTRLIQDRRPSRRRD